MGGEWWFYKKTSTSAQSGSESGSSSQSIKPLDVKEYQELLLQLKTEYEGQFDDKHVQWCDINALPPTDNVFVRFKYTCTRHTCWNEPEHPWFNLYWDPLLDINDYGSLHNKCEGTDGFKDWALFGIQRKIVEKFPEHFGLYSETSPESEYDSERPPRKEEYSYFFDLESSDDYTGCDKDCGYCGRCFHYCSDSSGY